MIYLTILAAFAALSFIYDYRQKESGRLFCWIVMLVVLICVSGFRYHVGMDSILYEWYFENELHTLGDLKLADFQATRFAVLYVLLTSACKTITPDFMLVQFVVSITVNCTIFWFIWKNTRHVYFAGFLYFFVLYILLNTEVLREAMAVSVFLWSWPLFKRKKWLAYYALAFVAFNFHLSAMVLFLLPLLRTKAIGWFFELDRRTFIILPFVLLLGVACFYFLFDFIQLVSMSETLNDRVNMYSHDRLSRGQLNFVDIAMSIVRLALYPLVALYFLKKNRKRWEEDEDNVLMERMVMLFVYFVMLSQGMVIFYRYYHYFQIFAFVTMANWTYSVLHFKRKLIRLNFVYWWLLFVPMFATQWVGYYNRKVNKSGSMRTYEIYYPYSNQFDQEIDPQRQRVINYNLNML